MYHKYADTDVYKCKTSETNYVPISKEVSK